MTKSGLLIPRNRGSAFPVLSRYDGMEWERTDMDGSPTFKWDESRSKWLGKEHEFVFSYAGNLLANKAFRIGITTVAVSTPRSWQIPKDRNLTLVEFGMGNDISTAAAAIEVYYTGWNLLYTASWSPAADYFVDDAINADVDYAAGRGIAVFNGSGSVTVNDTVGWVKFRERAA